MRLSKVRNDPVVLVESNDVEGIAWADVAPTGGGGGGDDEETLDWPCLRARIASSYVDDSFSLSL